MQHYEMTVLVRTDEDLAAISGFITQAGASVTGEQSLGRRRLAYPIAKETSAVYGVYTFDATSSAVAELNKKLEAAEHILRHLIIAGGVRGPKATTKKLTDKDLEVPESLTKGMAELAEAEKIAAATPTPAAKESAETTPETAAATPADEPEAKPKKTKKHAAESGEAEELTAEERQKKLNEKLEQILGN